MNLALFDFDHTLTTRDSFLGFIKYAVGRRDFYLAFPIMSFFYIQYLMNISSSLETKEKLLLYFFKKIKKDEFQSIATEYSLTQICKIENKDVVEKMLKHTRLGDRVIVVTASLECWVSPWCEEKGVECIGSKGEVIDGAHTGRLSGKNCKGKEKVLKIKEAVNIKDYQHIYVYGNMPDDKEMFSLGDTKIVV